MYGKTASKFCSSFKVLNRTLVHGFYKDRFLSSPQLHFHKLWIWLFQNEVHIVKIKTQWGTISSTRCGPFEMTAAACCRERWCYYAGVHSLIVTFWGSQKMGKQISWPLNTYQVNKQNRTAFNVSVSNSLSLPSSLSLPFSKEEFHAWCSSKAYFFSERQGLWCHPWQTVLSIFCSHLGYSRMFPSLPGTTWAQPCPHQHHHQYFSPSS